MRSAPWWALVSSGCAPVLLTGSWMIAQLRRGPAYDPSRQTLSVLASYGAASYWLMTGMLLVLGTCYVVTAHALRPHGARRAGRLAAWRTVRTGPDAGARPEQRRGVGARGRVHRGPRAPGGMASLAAVRDRRPVPWGLRLDVSLAASALMCASALWFLAELQSARAPGVAERVVTFVQALWPFLVVVSCRRSAA